MHFLKVFFLSRLALEFVVFLFSLVAPKSNPVISSVRNLLVSLFFNSTTSISCKILNPVPFFIVPL